MCPCLGACFEHRPLHRPLTGRMQGFCGRLPGVFQQRSALVHAWCVLPNHHALIETMVILDVLADLGGSWPAVNWLERRNADARKAGLVRRGGRYMRNDAPLLNTINCVHNNPGAHHGYVRRWQDWPFSALAEYLAQMGHDEAARIWKEYPVLDHGKGWTTRL